jgi:hypothetical protein
MDQIEPVFQFLEAPVRLSYGVIEKIASDTGIEAGTLRDWQEKVKKPRQPDQAPWRPYQGRSRHGRALTDEQEAMLARMIHEEFILPHRYCAQAHSVALLSPCTMVQRGRFPTVSMKSVLVVLSSGTIPVHFLATMNERLLPLAAG